MIFKNVCVLVLWMKVASALEGLRYFFGSPGGLGTLFCTLNLKIEFEIQVNELSKMFNNSNKKHSFRKSG